MILRKIQCGQEWQKGPCSAIMCPVEVRTECVVASVQNEWLLILLLALPSGHCASEGPESLYNIGGTPGGHSDLTRTSLHPLSNCFGWAVSSSHPRWRPTPIPWQVNFLPLSGAAAGLLTCQWLPGTNSNVGISFPCLGCGLWGGSGPPGREMRGAMGLGGGSGGRGELRW